MNKQTNEVILKRAIEKAVKNGWKEILPLGNLKIICTMTGMCEIHRDGELYATSNDIIFDHHFARAFWGKSIEDWAKQVGPGIHPKLLTWKDHLQKMVLEEDPIQYLAQFLDDE